VVLGHIRVGAVVPRLRSRFVLDAHDVICLPPDRATTNITLWHELGHVAIRVRYEDGEDVARTSEEFCSIYSVARMSPGVIDEDRIPYLGEPSAPAEEWPGICRRALEYREDHYDYIPTLDELIHLVNAIETGFDASLEHDPIYRSDDD